MGGDDEQGQGVVPRGGRSGEGAVMGDYGFQSFGGVMKRKALIVGVLMVPSLVSAQNISGPPYVAVHGEARMEVIPDVFPLDITLKETSKDTAATQAKIETLAQVIVDLAQAQHVADEDISIGNLSISPEMDYDEKTEMQVFLGNTYEREVKIRFHSLDRLREFLTKIPDGKAIHVDTGTFEYAKKDEAKRALLADAIRNAKATADEMARGVGKRISGVHTISNQSFNIRYAESSTTLDSVTVTGKALLAPGTVVLKEGRITLDQDVYIVYLLAD
jgi:uncharacterized protein YggE